MICSVTLTLLRPDSEPLEGITVSAFVRGTGVPVDAVTDASGEAQFTLESGSVVRFVCEQSIELNGNTVEIPNTSNFNVGTFTADAASEGDPGGDSLEKATGAEVDTGTDDAKYITPKALEDSDYIKEADLPPGGGTSNFYKGVDYVIFYSDLPAFTYDNGTAGVGATITANANGALESFGADNPATGDRVIILSQSGDAEAGIYDVTEAGDGSTPFVLTRSTDFDSSEKIIQGATVAIKNGDRFGQCLASVYSPSNPVIGSDGITIRTVRTDGMIESITAGSGISVDDTDPANPVVNASGIILLANGTVDLNSATEQTLYTVPTGFKAIAAFAVMHSPSVYGENASVALNLNGSASGNVVNLADIPFDPTVVYKFGIFEAASNNAFSVAAGSTISANVSSPEGSAMTASMDVFGYLIAV